MSIACLCFRVYVNIMSRTPLILEIIGLTLCGNNHSYSWMFWKNIQICLIFWVPFSSFRWWISHCGMEQIPEFGFGHMESYLAHHRSQTAISNTRRQAVPSGGEVLIGWENGWTGMELWDKEGDMQSANGSDKQVCTHTETHTGNVGIHEWPCKHKQKTQKRTHEPAHMSWHTQTEYFGAAVCGRTLDQWTSPLAVWQADCIKEAPADTQTHLSLPFNACLSGLFGRCYHQLWVFSNLRCCRRLFNFLPICPHFHQRCHISSFFFFFRRQFSQQCEAIKTVTFQGS